jgi:hypothetical protein
MPGGCNRSVIWTTPGITDPDVVIGKPAMQQEAGVAETFFEQPILDSVAGNATGSRVMQLRMRAKHEIH